MGLACLVVNCPIFGTSEQIDNSRTWMSIIQQPEGTNVQYYYIISKFVCRPTCWQIAKIKKYIFIFSKQYITSQKDKLYGQHKKFKKYSNYL